MRGAGDGVYDLVPITSTTIFTFSCVKLREGGETTAYIRRYHDSVSDFIATCMLFLYNPISLGRFIFTFTHLVDINMFFEGWG